MVASGLKYSLCNLSIVVNSTTTIHGNLRLQHLDLGYQTGTKLTTSMSLFYTVIQNNWEILNKYLSLNPKQVIDQ